MPAPKMDQSKGAAKALHVAIIAIVHSLSVAWASVVIANLLLIARRPPH